MQNCERLLSMKTTIGGITYDTSTAKRLANSPAASADQRLYQTVSGQFFLLVIETSVDGQTLGFHERWIELGQRRSASSRAQVRKRIVPLTSQQALDWCVKTQIPATLRGYLLDCI
jgi:hypothetical protein